MTTIAVTGIEGFLGWHTRVHFHARPEWEVLGITRSDFNDPGRLAEAVRHADVVLHLAGMNRGADEEIERTNVALTSEMMAACDRARVRPQMILANSTHCDRPTAYGRSKRRSADLLTHWASKHGAIFTNMVIPNVFGEGGRPFYNSVVATFCHQLASGEEPKILQDGHLELVHAQAVIGGVESAIEQRVAGDVPLSGFSLTVAECLKKLMDFDRCYRGNLIPLLTAGIDLDLFNTYRSFLYPRHYPVRLPLHCDVRGDLFEAVKSLNGGQCFISTTRPGVTRGHHYHAKKVERFLVLSGQAVIRIRKLFTKEVIEFKVSGSEPQYVDMPTFCTHSITNTGAGDLTTLFWAHELFDPQRPDTIREPVEV
jgi:UDP-2-acetamido-2,6-beta-L-arabino-hexul-4-ose reductase